jgi:hypothetical protein
MGVKVNELGITRGNETPQYVLKPLYERALVREALCGINKFSGEASIDLFQLDAYTVKEKTM